ncbi:MAG TPA: MBL fold metallo-hydrolase [Vicinamibacteria bacterium]|nr:MBL fold metallo-hydrolase [Vicinamibacteria bacterium]
MTLAFHGGAGTVTGSRYLLQERGVRVLVDAGMFQGLKRLRERNWNEPGFDARTLDCVLLTHAHIDHSGYLPRLVQQGLTCPVYCTRATFELAELLLMDAAKIQEEDAAFANEKGFSKHRPALPLYTTEDAAAAIALLTPVDYGAWIEPASGIRARFLNAGHILGAAMVEAHLSEGARESRIVFSGDVGRYDAPLHSNPDPLPVTDALVVESTYGDREHPSAPMEEQIRDSLLACIDRKGTVLIPSFAVGRSQLVTLILRELMRAGRLPDVPIHIDSPMAVDATRIYSRHLRDLSLDGGLTEDGRSRLFPTNVQFHRSVEESKRLNALSGPRIIISSSGMLTGGRVLHHLKRLLPSRNNLVVLVGFQAAGTRGRHMAEGADSVRIHGEDVPVRASFIQVSGLSAHADRKELLRWIQTADRAPRVAFITHGEPDSALSFKKLLQQKKLARRIFVPKMGESFDLSAMLNE